MLLAFALSGCVGVAGGGATTDTGAQSWAPPDYSADDEALLRRAIAGEVDPTDALDTIAARGGLPVETASGTWLFACICGAGTWAVAGDHDDWVGTEMALTGALSWLEIELTVTDGARYKFTGGSGEAIWMSDPRGRRFAWDDFGELSLVRSDAAHLQRFYDLQDDAGLLVSRDLQVWMPEGGNWSRLLLAHDGQNLFDPAPAPPASSWSLQDVVPDGVLVVGIDSTYDRIAEYTPTTDLLDGQTNGGGAGRYGAFVQDVVRTVIFDQYGPPDVVGVMGSSLGGLASLSIADQHPGAYDMAISMSGTLGWGSIGQDGPTIVDSYRSAGHRDTALYVDSGGSGTCWDDDGDGVPDDDLTASDNYCENAWFRDVLANELGYVFDQDLWHWHEPGASHNESAWGGRVWRPLEIFAEL
jgi:hypothetical protein